MIPSAWRIRPSSERHRTEQAEARLTFPVGKKKSFQPGK